MNNFETVLNSQRNSFESVEDRVLKTSLYHKHRNLMHLDIGSKEKIVGLGKQMTTFPVEELQYEKTGNMIITRTKFGDLSASDFLKENLYDLLSKVCRHRLSFPVRNLRFFKTGYRTHVLGFPAFFALRIFISHRVE